MDPFSSFDLFRRRVDQMFADFDQQMFGSSDPFAFPLLHQQNQQQQQQHPRIGHEKEHQLAQGSGSGIKEEERVIPHTGSSGSRSSASTSNSNRSLSTLPSSTSSSLDLFQWPSTSSLLPSMKMDLIEDKDCYLIHADVPGFKKDEIQLNIKDGMLTLTGEHHQSKEERDPDRKYHRIERSSGSLHRSIRLPDSVKQDEISASCEHGLLKIVLPKDERLENKKQRAITIE